MIITDYYTHEWDAYGENFGQDWVRIRHFGGWVSVYPA